MLDLPAGTLKGAIVALGEQAGASFSVADRALWQRRVPAVHGRMTVAEALARLLGPGDAEFVAIDERTWRITRARPPALRRASYAPPRRDLAEDAAPPVDIIVTASKRDTSIRDYQGTVTVIDGEELAFGGPGGSEALASRSASITSTHLGSGRNKLFVRGIADSSFTGPSQATVGQYLGDLRLTYNAPDPSLRLYDIAAVEVLEGPQGTLHGAGSLGGIVRVVRNAPALDRFDAAMSLGAATTAHGSESVDGGAMVNLPLVADHVGLRLVGYGASDGGYIDDLERGIDDVNRVRTTGGRAQLRIEPGAGWMIDIGGVAQKIRGEDSQYADRDGPPLTRRSTLAQAFSDDYRLAELTVTKDWGDLRFVSANGYVRQKVFERFDATQPGGPALRIAEYLLTASGIAGPVVSGPAVDEGDRDPGPATRFDQRNSTRMFVSENRLSRRMRDGFGFVVGASFIRNQARLTREVGQMSIAAPLTGVSNRIEELTLFGEASVEPVKGLTVTTGGRLSRSKLSGSGLDVTRALVASDRRMQGGRAETTFLPSISASAAPVDDVILFLRYQQGFRPGGLAISDDFIRRFENDRVETIEMGARYGVAGLDRLSFAGTVAHTRWSDIQADFLDGNGLPTTANVGDGRIWSFDTRVAWRPFDALGIEAAFVYNDTKLIEPDAMFAVATSRHARLPNVAQYGGRIGFDLRTAITDAVDLRAAGWGRYVGKSRLGIGPVLGALQGGYVDTGLTARLGWDRFGVTLGVTNLFDRIGNRFALGAPFDAYRGEEITPLRPRTIRIGIDARL